MSRRTARFEKVMLTPGKYMVAYNGSDRVEQEFTPERLAKIAATGQQMIKNGLRIPVPFKHFDSNAHTPTPVTLSDSGIELDPITGKPIVWDASINGGFAESLKVNEDGALVAVLESFGDENDHNTPAGKIGTTCQETSIGLAAKYMDGKGNIYEDAPIHIAACIKAVEPGQSNFVLLGEEEISKVSGDLSIVSMSSQLITMAAPANGAAPNFSEDGNNRDLSSDSNNEIEGKNITADVPTLLNLLRKLESPIDLPDDTTDDTLVERLVIAVNQKICDEETEEEIEPGEGNATPQPPQNSQEKQGTITMTTPAAPAQPNQESVLLMSMLANQQKTTLEQRVAKLKEKNVSDDLINKYVTPNLGLELTTMSLADFDVASGKLKNFEKAELALSIIEDMSTQIVTMDLSQGIGYEPGMQEVAYSEPNTVDAETQKTLDSFTQMLTNGSQHGFNSAAV